MAISLVGTATGTNTATAPAHQAGDLFLVFTFRDGSTTPPTLASGFTTSSNGGGNTCSHRVGWKIASSSSETVGTWSNATSLILIVLRGADQASPIGANNLSTGASTTITYPSLTMQVADGSSWVFAFGGHRSANVAIDTVPSGMTLTASVSDATDEAAAFRLEGATSFTSRTSAVGGTSSGWRSSSIEVLVAAELPPPTEYTQTSNITSFSSLSAQKAAVRISGITSSGSVSRALSAGKRASIAGLSSPSRSFVVNRSIGIASSGAVASVKAMSRTLSLVSVGAVLAVASRAYILTLSISSAASVGSSKAIGKTRAITGGASVASRKAIGKAFTLASDGEASIRKVAGKVASVMPISSIAAQKAVGVGRAVPAASVVTALKSLSASFSVASAGIVSAFKDVAPSLAVVSSAAVALTTAFVEATGFLRGKVSRGIMTMTRSSAGTASAKPAKGAATKKSSAGSQGAIRRAFAGIIKRKR